MGVLSFSVMALWRVVETVSMHRHGTIAQVRVSSALEVQATENEGWST